MNLLHITGFDSAWGGTQKGAICDLSVDKESEEITLSQEPTSVSWSQAVDRVESYRNHKHHIMAIDQGLIVPNVGGMRPVELKLARALGKMGCSAYPSNRSNLTCYGADAGIWRFQRALGQSSFLHQPMSVPGGKDGKFYFECYPHPSIIGMMKRDKILKYKCRHKNSNDWDALRRFLSELPIRNIATILKNLAGQTKANEDKLDSIVCAWTAYLWWKNGKQGSLMAGSMETGYIVTPVTDQMRTSLQKQFGEEINNGEGVTPSIPEPRVTETAMVGNSPRFPHSDDARTTNHPAENAAAQSFRTTAGDWSDIVELFATDTTNLARNKNRKVINPWLDRFQNYRLFVKLVEEDGEPEIVFVPHSHSENQKTLMPDRCGQPGVWRQLVAGASKSNTLCFHVRYRYTPLN